MKKDPTSPDRPDLFSKIFKHCRTNCIIIMDEHGIILQVNDAFKNSFGYSDEKIIGQHSRILFTEKDRKALRPEMEIALVKKDGFALDQNYALHANGEHIWVSGEAVWAESKEHGNCVVKIIQNIHAQKVQEKFLVEANELSQTIIESIEDGLLVVNTKLMIMKANNAFREMFGLKTARVEGIYLPELNYSLRGNVQMQEKLKMLLDTGHIDEEIEWNFPGGNKRMLRLLGKFLEDAGDKQRILLLFSDITQEREAAQQREDLINFVSHELRNPLANLALVVELMKDALISNNVEEGEEYLDKAKANLRRLKQVISELHDASSAGAGHLTIQKTSFGIRAMIKEAVDTVKMLFPSHEVILQSDTDPVIHADRFRLIQVLNNYLTNAMKYSPGGHKIFVNVVQNNGHITVSVADTGPGIPADQLPYVFDKYYRGRSTVKIDGLGLGLYVCREIISAHGGEVWAVSEENKGSTFYFSIPV